MPALFTMRYIIAFILMFIPAFLFAGPYIKIESIDSKSNYPSVKVCTQIKGISKSEYASLDDENISLIEDGVEIKNFNFSRDSNGDNFLYLILSIDSSKSISRTILSQIKLSARDIVKSIGPQDKIAIYHFDDEAMLLRDFTRDIGSITKSIDGIRRHGKKTLLYNSIHDSIVLFEKIEQNNKKIIVFTDGKDEGSSIKDDDIIQLARTAGIPVYFICFKDSKNIRTMARISKLTGGKLIYGKNHEDISGMYATILTVMRSRYSIFYTTNLKRDGQNHKLEIRLNQGDMHDRDQQQMLMPDMQLIDYFLYQSNAIYLGINVMLLFVIFLVIVFFIVREKRIIQDRFGKASHLIQESLKKNNYEISLGQDDGTESNIDAELINSQAWLLQKNGNEIGKKFQIPSKEITIGRDADNTIAINDDMMSPKQCKIVSHKGVFYLLDLISENGTYLNGNKLLRPKTLHDWDELKLGNTVLLFRGSHRRD
jgi:VWFA-related protein